MMGWSPQCYIHNTKFRGNWFTGSGEDFLWVFTIYGHSGHVTSIMLINLHFHVSKMLHIKFGSKWPNGLCEKQFLIFIC